MTDRSTYWINEPIEENSFEKFLRENPDTVYNDTQAIEKIQMGGKTIDKVEINKHDIKDLLEEQRRHNEGQFRRCKHCITQKIIGSYCDTCSVFTGNTY